MLARGGKTKSRGRGGRGSRGRGTRGGRGGRGGGRGGAKAIDDATRKKMSDEQRFKDFRESRPDDVVYSDENRVRGLNIDIPSV